MLKIVQGVTNAFTSQFHNLAPDEYKHEEPGLSSWYSDFLWTRWSGVRILVRARDFLISKPSRSALWPNKPPIQGVPWFFLVVIRLRQKFDHPLPSGTEVMNEWNYTFTPPCAFMV
jgi:hypothetical protein